MKDEFDDEMELPEDDLMADESPASDVGVMDVDIETESDGDEGAELAHREHGTAGVDS